MVESVERLVARIQPHGEKQFWVGLLLDDDFQIAQLPAKASGKFIEDARDFFSEFIVIQRQ